MAVEKVGKLGRKMERDAYDTTKMDNRVFPSIEEVAKDLFLPFLRLLEGDGVMVECGQDFLMLRYEDNWMTVLMDSGRWCDERGPGFFDCLRSRDQELCESHGDVSEPGPVELGLGSGLDYPVPSPGKARGFSGKCWACLVPGGSLRWHTTEQPTTLPCTNQPTPPTTFEYHLKTEWKNRSIVRTWCLVSCTWCLVSCTWGWWVDQQPISGYQDGCSWGEWRPLFRIFLVEMFRRHAGRSRTTSINQILESCGKWTDMDWESFVKMTGCLWHQ